MQGIKKPKVSGMFDSSDEDDDMQFIIQKKEQMNIEKKNSAKKVTEEEDVDVKFGAGDFVGEKEGKIESRFYFMKPPLGVGLFGTVYKARDRQTGHIRAIKKIRKDHAKAKDFQTLLRDVDILKKLNHPNIIKVYEFYQDSGNFYIVTDFCAGGELFDRILQEKNFNENRAAEMMKYIISAIAYCHSQKLVHCDLKPENILLESQNYDETLIKIIDFGNSNFCKPGEMLNSKFGSVYYVAPEVLKSRYNEKCDVWSLGVILFLLLSGKPPFSGATDKQILRNVFKGEFSMDGQEWELISNEAKDLISKMLTLDIEKRISAADALEHPWFHINTKEKKLRLDLPIGRRSLRNLKDFRAKNKLQDAILFFLVNQLTSKEEEQELLDQFLTIDSDGDGMLSKSDLLKAYAKSGKDPRQAEAIVDNILDNADKTGSGMINYSEFVTASISKRKFFSEERLTTAFKMFDSEDKGFIGVKELKGIFNNGVFNKIDDSIWGAMIDSLFVNEKPEVDVEEKRINFDMFKTMMTKFTENEHITQSIKFD